MSGNQNMAGDKNRDEDRGTSNGNRDGDMTVREAGHLGGEKGGQRERERVEKGHDAEQQGGGR